MLEKRFLVKYYLSSFGPHTAKSLWQCPWIRFQPSDLPAIVHECYSTTPLTNVTLHQKCGFYGSLNTSKIMFIVTNEVKWAVICRPTSCIVHESHAGRSKAPIVYFSRMRHTMGRWSIVGTQTNRTEQMLSVAHIATNHSNMVQNHPRRPEGS